MEQIVFTDILKDYLAERVRIIGKPRVHQTGKSILYWMRTAIRADENPALNVAIAFANHMKLPLLVYQGLTERYPYASDRHHMFVLQGARDVQQEFASRNIPYALHVERPQYREPFLKQLATEAALVVTEDMPVEPLRSWTAALARHLKCSVLAVDTACVVPMRMAGKSYDRAFAYRNATEKFYKERIGTRMPELELHQTSRSSMNLPFTSIDLQRTDPAEIVNECEIDHSIGPVPHTIGGAKAGCRRWDVFRREGLASYDRRRNDALLDGVSRMSPYLHYGMVAPFRLAREADEQKSKGGAKFLDELLIWRELAYAFCFYRRDHGRLSAIPGWARSTMEEHRSDPRHELFSWEAMARGETGDALWDTAQKSLLIHGELHNNVRMTWGKAILNWTKDASHALKRLIDLNHRYALDGRDPASYGGILWCLGQFDRPFEPARPILGTVRDRSTQQHAKRLDIQAYRRKIMRTGRESQPTIAVVGAGLSGLVCARTLTDHGLDVTVFEKSRGVSGRMSTRRVNETTTFDHGAQYFTVRDRRFKRYVESWVDEGIVKPWAGRIAVVEKGIVKEKKRSVCRYVGVPGMNCVGKHLARSVNVRCETKVAPFQKVDDKWLLTSEDGSTLGAYDIVLGAVPSQQFADLAVVIPELAQWAASIQMGSCWAVLMAFDHSLESSFDGAFVHQSPLSWIARNNSKHDGTSSVETWVAHSDSDWADQHRNDTPAEVQRILVEEFWKAIGVSASNAVHTAVHRWLFALPKQSQSEQCLFDVDNQIGACGDWCYQPRVEGAFLSGMALAGRILTGLPPTEEKKARDHQLALF